MRFSVSAITFFVTFALSSVIALFFQVPSFEPLPIKETTDFQGSYGCPKPKDKIASFIRRDIDNGRKMEFTATNFSAYSQTSLAKHADAVNEYVKASSAMDDSEFPTDFRQAWREHMGAWREKAEYLKDLKVKTEDADLTGEKVSEVFSFNSSEIRSTWYEVLRIGKKYGAEIPADAY